MNCEELNSIEGLKFMPVKANKQPIIKAWQTSTDVHKLTNCDGVGLVCGELSGSLEAIDIDQKYSLDKKLFDNYKRVIHSCDSTLLSKLVVQKTQSGGYHFLYKCSKISGNLKLANRATTDVEKQETFDLTYAAEVKKSTPDEKARTIAEKASKNDKVRVLIETRGEGGFVMCFPSEHYEIIHGDFYSISEITPDERDLLHNIARQFNTYVEEYSVPIKTKLPKTQGTSPFDDYNMRGDIVGLLEQHGWRIVTQKGSKTVFLRPGQTTSASSGNFDHEKNWFSVFTTSTEFEPQHAYLPYAVYAFLECDRDFTAAYKKLYDLGFGERQEEKKQPESTRVIKSRINPTDDDFSFIATPNDYDEYLQQVIDGTLPQGLTTGSPLLDKNFLFKDGNLVMINGIDNVGKSAFTWFLLLLAAMYHGWKGVIFSSENTLGGFMRKMIQFYWGKPLNGTYAMSQMEYKVAKDFVEKHFMLIKAQEDLFNYKDIINMIKKARARSTDLKYCMIDPYNSLKIDLSGFSKLSTHEYHYEALSEIKSYGQQSKFGWFVTNHAVTSALRAKDGERKYPVAPRKEDTEGGGKFPNKADEFLTIHRVTAHPTEWMITEVHVRKVKDTDTGGRVTPLEEPIKFEMYKGGTAFIERFEDGTNGLNPIEEWHRLRSPKQTEIKIERKIQEGWKPYKDNDIDF